jgi:hypothetical protein
MPVGIKLVITLAGALDSVKLTDAFVEALRGNPMRRMLRKIAREANEFRKGITHIDTGTLVESEKAEEVSRTKWQLYFDGPVNPKNRLRAVDYALYEDKRGFPHDFQTRTAHEIEGIADRYVEEFAAEVERQ